jgi:multidrug resistance efflux pump/putative methionine-R-sulfoxide reductase with GAF domain
VDPGGTSALAHSVADTGLAPKHLALLYEAGLEFNSTLDAEELLPRVFDRIIEALDAEAGSIWLRSGETLICRIARGPVGEKIEGLELPMGAGIVGDVARRGESELVSDVSGDSRFVYQVDEATGFATRSVATVPLKAKEEVIGALQILNKRSGSGMFDEADLALLDGLAATAGLALHNAQLHDAEKRARDLKAMLDISRETTSTLDMDRLVVSLVNLGSRLLAYDRAAVVLDEAGKPELRAISGQEAFDPKSEENRELVRLISWLAERNEVVYVPALEADEVLPTSIRSQFLGYTESAGVKSLCLVPLGDEEGRLGALYMESGSAGFLGESGLEAAQLLATQASVALRNAELYGQVPLIGLLEPVAEWRSRMASLPRLALLRKVVVPVAVVIGLALIPWRERITPRTAELIPGDRMPVRAMVDGLLTEVRVEEGDEVQDGDILAVLRDDEIRMQIAEVEGELATARREAAAGRAGGDETRARMGEIRAEELRENLSLLEDQLGRTRIRAPVGGVVLTVRPYEMLGEYLNAGETFVLLGRTDRLQLEAAVKQQDIQRVELGHPVRLKVAAHPAHLFVGAVSEIAPAAEVRSGSDATVTVWADLDNEERLLRPGLEARAKIVGARKPVGYLILRPLVRWMQMRFWR